MDSRFQGRTGIALSTRRQQLLEVILLGPEHGFHFSDNTAQLRRILLV